MTLDDAYKAFEDKPSLTAVQDVLIALRPELNTIEPSKFVTILGNIVEWIDKVRGEPPTETPTNERTVPPTEEMDLQRQDPEVP